MYFSDQLPLPNRHPTPKQHQIVCYDVTKPVFKWLQKTTSPKKLYKYMQVCSGVEWVVWSGVEWSEPKFSDHSPHVRIVGELINLTIKSFPMKMGEVD